MDRATLLALDRINREFYATRAAEFSATRETPWPGWERLLPHLDALETARGAALRILDVGCGSGRLARWLRTRLARPHRVVGLDRSLPLLRLGIAADQAEPARCAGGRSERAPADEAGAPPGAGSGGAALAAPRSFRSPRIASDLVSTGGVLPCRDAAFDAAVAIGLFHHLPSFLLRRALMAELLRVLRRGGLVAAAFWQLGSDPRMEARATGWEHAPGVEESEVEPGDRLLLWGAADPRHPGADLRYCHQADAPEIERLTGALPARTIATFRADGRDGARNLYVVLQRT
jgi:SAM-dependent methyltransferase